MADPLPTADQAPLNLLRALAGCGYRFITPTPATHARVIARRDRARPGSLADIFGWSLPFEEDALEPALLSLLRGADMLDETNDLLRSRVRVSWLEGQLYLHSAYPTTAADSVFFGPDSYRFASLIGAELEARPLAPGATIADIGTGAGVGAIVAAAACPQARVWGTDVNGAALRLADLNAQAAGVELDLVEGSGLEGVRGPLDLVTVNPPYIIDGGARTYRDGGDMHGGRVSLDLSRLALDALAPGGRLILYTGSAIVDGRDELRRALEEAAHAADCTVRYREIDPDVFGEELENEGYRDVDRIALVSAVFTKG